MAETIHCPKRNALKPHCDHALPFVYTMDPPIQPYVCCFCGRERRVSLSSSGGSYTFRPEDHGEYYRLTSYNTVRGVYSVDEEQR